ncbi:hypothetical protein INS49_011083 [Diaporthe citri]|uniref:uncharacterized protein n=1 Tax=Diaporthe citri TaxID=83186 RepID=UPI001C7FBCE8|nr:uncharacterized protein INS49_011083 [Diaporthe citri]KAG6360027.1 hypothetical protein INS49_011083 [Diaporthe citri]
MTENNVHEFLAALPKCEHHMHLEGSLSPELLFQLSERNKIALPAVSEDPAFASPAALYERYARFSSLDDFLHYYYIGFTVLIKESDFEDLAYAYFEKAAAQGVRHAEVFFDPQVHVNRGVAYETVVGGFTKARRRAGGARRLEPADPTMRDAGHFRDGTLAGMGLCSTEKDSPPKMWKEAFDLAKKEGVRLTAHAGEEGPAAYVTEALDELSVSRIDHGVNARHDEAVMERLARERVLLSVCPMSNVVLRGVTKISEVPIRTFLDKGVRFSISSDDPAYFGGYILDNYYAVQEAFNLSVDEWNTIAVNAVEGSWCGQTRKSEILWEIEKLVAETKGKEAA